MNNVKNKKGEIQEKRYFKEGEDIIEFPLTHDIVFSLVMQEPEICRHLLELIFPEKEIGSIRIADRKEDSGYTNIQQVLVTGIFTKGVRLDVFMIDDNEWYDIELQCQEKPDLPKRSRYYHSTMDISMLRRGQTYGSLKPSYVIFICTFDAFEENLPVYHFKNLCEEKTSLQLGDENCTIFLNAVCNEESIPEKLKRFFRYLCKMESCEEDPFIKEIHNRVKELNTAEGRKILWTLEDKINEEKAVSYEKGLKEALEQSAAAMLRENLDLPLISRVTGLSPEELEKLQKAEEFKEAEG